MVMPNGGGGGGRGDGRRILAVAEQARRAREKFSPSMRRPSINGTATSASAISLLQKAAERKEQAEAKEQEEAEPHGRSLSLVTNHSTSPNTDHFLEEMADHEPSRRKPDAYSRDRPLSRKHRDRSRKKDKSGSTEDGDSFSSTGTRTRSPMNGKPIVV